MISRPRRRLGQACARLGVAWALAGCGVDLAQGADDAAPSVELAASSDGPPGPLGDLSEAVDRGPPADLSPRGQGPTSDVAEAVLATWAVGESPTDAIEACAPRTLGLISLAADAQHTKAGAQAVRLDYGPDGEKYFDGLYPRGRAAAWDLGARAGLAFWLDAQLPPGYLGWQFDGPTVVLCNDAARFRRLDPAMNLTARQEGSWIELRVPLGGGAGWTAIDTGRFEIGAVNWIELHFNPYRNAMPGTVQVWLDDVRFY